MPRGDGTGPGGMGPMTGRAAGYCAGSDAPGFATGWPGRMLGLGAGRGRRNRFYATGLPGWGRSAGFLGPNVNPNPYGPPDAEARKQGLQNQASFLQTALDQVKKLLADLEGNNK